MKESAPPSVLWAEQQQTRTVALNVGWRYVNVGVELLLGLGMLPFNAKSLGASDYGLWVLASSMVAYFPVLDLGFGGAMERFVAHYRALRNADAINEIASTLIALFSVPGAGWLSRAYGDRAQLRDPFQPWTGAGAHRRNPDAARLCAGGGRTALRHLRGDRQRLPANLPERRGRDHRDASRRLRERRSGEEWRHAGAAGCGDDRGPHARLRGLSLQRLSRLPAAPHTYLTDPAHTAEGSRRVQHLHADAGRLGEAQLRDRPDHHCRSPLHGRGGGVDGRAAACRRRPADDQSAELHAVPHRGGRRCRQQARAYARPC